MKSHKEFEHRIKKSLNLMDAKIDFLHDGVTGLRDAFKEFNEEITDFMAFTAENYADHEQRIKELEKHFK